MMRFISNKLRFLLVLLLMIAGLSAFASEKDYPEKPSPPKLVNDLAHILKPNEVAQLEEKLEDFAVKTSTQITIVTITNLGGHDVQEYSVEVFRKWGLGQKSKNNGVLVLVAMDDRKAWITTGYGLEGVLNDGKAGTIFRNELQPNFKKGLYYDGLANTAEAIIAVTKDEYKADGLHKDKRPMPLFAIIILIVIVAFILKMFRGGGGGNGGGGYMSGRGFNNVATGILLGELLGGRGGGGWGGGSSGGGGGWGGFGGGSTGGGGAGGSW